MKLENVEDIELDWPQKPQTKEPRTDSQNVEKAKAESFLSIWEVLLPLVQMMRVTGKYVDTATKPISPPKESGTLRRVPIRGIIWCFFMTAIYFTSTLRFVVVVAIRGNGLKDKVPETIACLMFLSNFVLGVWIIYKNRQLPALLENIDTFHRSYGPGYKKPLLKVKRRIRIMTICGLVGGGISSFIFYFYGSYSLDWLIYPLDNETGTTQLLVQIVSALLSTFFTFGIISISILFMPLGMVLGEDFQIFNEDIRVSLNKKASSLLAEEVERFRERWEELCSLVEQMDGIYKSYALTSYMFTFVTICLIAIGLGQNTLDTTSLCFVLGICIFSIVDTISVTVLSVQLHMKAHESKESLLKVKLDKLSEKTVQIINVFLGRLTGPSIGFSVCGFFTIDVGAILTLVSTLVAYVIVVLQFPSGETTCVFTFPNSTTLSPSNWTMTTAPF